MATVQVTEQNFEATVKQGIVLLDFWASWCGPCRAFAPVFDAAAARHPGVVFGKVDTDALDQALRDVPPADRCRCREERAKKDTERAPSESTSWFRKLISGLAPERVER